MSGREFLLLVVGGAVMFLMGATWGLKQSREEQRQRQDGLLSAPTIQCHESDQMDWKASPPRYLGKGTYCTAVCQ